MMEQYFEILSNAIKVLDEPNWLDYIQVIATIISVIVSAVAVVMAVKIPKKIADKQDRIALFDKRFLAYFSFQRYEAYARLLKGVQEPQNYKELFVNMFYDGEHVEFQARAALFKLIQISIPLEQMSFLFKKITDDEIDEMYSSLIDFVVALDTNDEVEKQKHMYINVVETFIKKHKEYICNILEIDC